MSQALPQIYLARHGETAWTLSGQHTGLSDIPLTERGERNARRLGKRLQGRTFARVFSSPCSARAAPVSWPASVRSPWSMRTSSSGITAPTKAEPAPTSAKSNPTGICSAMGAEWRECGRCWRPR